MSFSTLCQVFSTLQNSTYRLFEDDIIEWYINNQLFMWFMLLLIPVLVLFCLPFITYFILCGIALYTQIYYHWNLARGVKYSSTFWDNARTPVANFLTLYGRIWYGYEVIGIDNIPKTGSALLIFYHGALPVDWYLLTSYLLNRHVTIHAVGDKFLFKIPGWKSLLEAANICIGSVKSCSEVLKNGSILSIAPGGVREAQFADETYPLLWGERVGFAKVAIEGKAPIIPVFTQNIREAFRPLSIGKSLFRKIYEKTRFPLVPIYGGLPVKLRTIIGKPILYDNTLTPAELASKTASAIKELIVKHQHLPGSMFRALCERISENDKRKCL